MFQLATVAPRRPVHWPNRLARWSRVGSACVDIRPSHKSDVLVVRMLCKCVDTIRYIYMRSKADEEPA